MSTSSSSPLRKSLVPTALFRRGPANVVSVDRLKDRRVVPPLRGLLPLCVLLGVWELRASSRSPFYPPPSRWWKSLVTLWDQQTLLPAVTTTVETILIGLALATAIGTALGVLTGAFGRVDRALGPTLEMMRATPTAAVVPVAALIIGYTHNMTLTVVALSSLWPILLGTRSAMLNLNPLLLDVGTTLKLSRRARATKILLPALVPSILLGITVAAPMALIVTLLVQIITAQPGIGALIGTAQNEYDSAAVYGLVAVAGILALVISVSVAAIGHFARRYLPPERH